MRVWVYLFFACLHLFFPVRVWGVDSLQEEFPRVPISELLLDIADFLAVTNEESFDMEGLMEQIDALLTDPVPIYRADIKEFRRLFWLSPFQESSLLEYIQGHGPPVSLYELAYIPGFNLSLVRTLSPFIILRAPQGDAIPIPSPEFRQRLVFGFQRVLEKQKGYVSSGSSSSSFLGSPDKWYLRYQLQRGSKFSFGFLAEKDPGEEFLKKSNRKGFDFYSGYGLWKPSGLVKTLLIGDYKADFGYGLLLSSSLSLDKSTAVSRPAKVPFGLRGYSSSSESGFFRGFGVVLGQGAFETSLFGSFQHRDAIGVREDSVADYTGIRSIVTSGTHATANDLVHRNVLEEQDFGVNISYQTDDFRMALTGFWFRYSLPLLPGIKPYQRFDFSGTSALTGSLDYTYVSKKWLVFGEQSLSESGVRAWIQGLQIRLGGSVHTTIAYRSYSPSYYAPYGNALSEGSAPSNERGYYMGCSIPMGKRWQLTTYTDFFFFPWMQSNVSAPSQGNDFFVKMDYVYATQNKISIQWRQKNKPLDSSGVMGPRECATSAWRVTLVHEIASGVRIKSQLEYKNSKKPGRISKGFYYGQDVSVKHAAIPLEWAVRFAFFDTYDYDSRIYAYESDMLYAYSVPSFFDRGVRMYIQARYSLGKSCDMRFKWSRTAYPQKEIIGSGLTSINKNTRTEVRVQVLFRFRSKSIGGRRPTSDRSLPK